MIAPRWKIYYSDGSTFSNQDGAPHEAPTVGFISAVGFDNDGNRYQMNGWDHYRFDNETGQWWGMDLFGVFDRLRWNKEVYAYKEGRTLGNRAYQDLVNACHRDADFKGASQ